MIKRLFSFLFVLVGVLLFNLPCFAEDSVLFNEQIEASGADELFEYLDDEQLEMLKKLGLDSLDFESAFSVSPRKVFDLIYQAVSGRYVSALSSCTGVALMVVAAAFAKQFFSLGGSGLSAVNTVSSLCIALALILPLGTCITRVASAVELAADFMLALIPVLATVLTVSGNPAAALTYNSLCFFLAQIVSQLSANVILPVIRVCLSLSFMSGVAESVSFESLVSFVKKTVMFLMSFMATVFITMLTIKGMLASASDTVAVRGIRFLIGNLIPVVGGAMSDAYLSVVGALVLVKSTVAVFGVAAICVISLPVIAECVSWIFSLNLLAMLSDMLSGEKISPLIRSVSSAVTLLTALLVLVSVVFILSIGLIALMKGGG